MKKVKKMAGINFFDSSEVAWKDLQVRIAGAVTNKITGLRYKVKQDKEHLYAAGDRPIGIQSGNKAYEGEIKLLKGDLDAMNLAAIAAGGSDITDVPFDIVATYKASGARPLSIATIIGVEISEFEQGMSQGDKKMEITLPFLALDVIQ